MGLFFRNYLEEGYYEEDGYGDLTKITNPKEIVGALEKGVLFENDGMGITKVNKNDEINFNLGNVKNIQK